MTDAMEVEGEARTPRAFQPTPPNTEEGQCEAQRAGRALALLRELHLLRGRVRLTCADLCDHRTQEPLPCCDRYSPDATHNDHSQPLPGQLVWRAAMCGLRLLFDARHAWCTVPPALVARAALAVQVRVMVEAEHPLYVTNTTWLQGCDVACSLKTFSQLQIRLLQSLDFDVVLGVPDPFRLARDAADYAAMDATWRAALHPTYASAALWALAAPEAEAADLLRKPHSVFVLEGLRHAARTPVPTVAPWVQLAPGQAVELVL